MKANQESRYFQTIAHCFFEQRGAPFFLSSKELGLITAWKNKGIPLHVVLEGINNAFLSYRSKPGRKSKVLSLQFCQKKVQKAFASYKERKVGGSAQNAYPKLERENKTETIKKEITRFLNQLPSQLEYLRGVYARAQNILSSLGVDEEKLEEMEKKIENLLWSNAPEEDRERIKKNIGVEYKIEDEQDFNRIYRVKLIKYLRDKYKVPYISPYYY